MLKHLLFSVLLISVSSLHAQKDYALEIVDTLCAEHFDGRGYVNQGDNRSADFIVEELQRIGVSPFPEKGYTQEYFINVNTFPHQIRVILDQDTLNPGEDYLVSAISGSAQGSFDVFELNKKTFYDTFDGRINFSMMDPSQTVFAFNFLDTLDKPLQKKILSLSYEATKFFPSIYVTNKKQMYSVGRKQSNYPRISIDSAAYHTATKAEIVVNNKFIPRYKTKNVIGFIPGKKKKKYVVLTGHYDHLGRMGPDAMFPGANDNASGVAMLLSLAKHFKENKPKYSIVFCFFSGEEAGLVGSQFFVEHPYFPLKRVKMVLNIDIMGGAEEGITVVNATKHQKLYEKMVDINEEWQLIPKVKRRGPSANSDHHFFSESGVPAFFIYSMGAVKNYHDVYDTAENTPLTNFDEVQELIERFIDKL